jgi:hypothetical protein
VLELVSWRVLEMVEVEKSGFFRTKKVAVLRKGEGTTNNEVLLAVRDLYLTSDESEDPDGVSGSKSSRWASKPTIQIQFAERFRRSRGHESAR